MAFVFVQRQLGKEEMADEVSRWDTLNVMCRACVSSEAPL